MTEILVQLCLCDLSSEQLRSSVGDASPVSEDPSSAAGAVGLAVVLNGPPWHLHHVFSFERAAPLSSCRSLSYDLHDADDNIDIKQITIIQVTATLN